MNGKLSRVVAGIILVILTVSASHGFGKEPTFNPDDPRMRDTITVNSILDSYIQKNDRDNAERLKAYTLDRASKFVLLLMIEFGEELSLGKLEKLREGSPRRWELLQRYMNESQAWLSLGIKTENFLGGDLAKEIKNALGENNKYTK